MPPHKLRSILHFCLPHPFFRDFCLSVPHLFFGSLSFSVSHSFFRTLPFQRLSPLLRILFFSISYSLFRTLPLKCPLHLLRIPSFSVSHPFPPFKCPPPLLRTLSFSVSRSSFRILFSLSLPSFPEPCPFNAPHFFSCTLPFQCLPPPFFFPSPKPSPFCVPPSLLTAIQNVSRSSESSLYPVRST